MNYMATTYDQRRQHMHPGDVILFGGRGPMSRLVQAATRSRISHAGIISHVQEDRLRVKVTDSTSLNGRLGVVTRYMSDVIREYDGSIYWLPLRPGVRRDMDLRAMAQYIDAMDGVSYDIKQCIRAGFKSVFRFSLRGIDEDTREVFCSEFVAFALIKGGAILDDEINASETTPIDLVKLGIYAQFYYQFKGKHRPLRRLRKV